MNRPLPIIILLLLTIVCYHTASAQEPGDTLRTATPAAEEMRDTIFATPTAAKLRIITDDTHISIIVEKFGDTSENFYYKTGTEDGVVAADQVSTMSKYNKVTNLSLIEEGNSTLIIAFNGETNMPNYLSFDIPDPANRYVETYTGTSGKNRGVNLNFNRTGKGEWLFVSCGLGLGWSTPTDASMPMGTSMGKSLEFVWLMIGGVKWSYRSHAISAGLGYNYKTFHLRRGSYFHKNEDRSIGVLPYSDSQEEASSYMSVMSLTVPILYDLSFNRSKRFGIAVGPVVNFNVRGGLGSHYRIGDTDYTLNTRHIGQRPVTVDIFGAVRYSPFSLYVRYSPMTLLRQRAGLDFGSFSTGIMLFF